ncbi:MAG: hypothetical protein K2G69_07860, partial [Muribaculaceae bacterium]|nr:hypothetical protein [Muribaculaceae bacterium]
FTAPEQVPDGTTGITLRIPNPQGAAEFAKTRSENPDTRADQSAAEGAIVGNDLYFLAFGSGNNVVRKHLTESTLQTLSNDYKQTTIDLVPDTYRFYVVGNLSNYAPAGTDFFTISEENLKSLVLEFNATSKALTPANGLPMVCLPNEIKKGETVVTSGEYLIEAGDNPTIKADLSFLCSKVRYTILFDNAQGGISNAQFGPANFLDFDGASATSLETYTKMSGDGVPYDPNNIHQFNLSSITLNKVENPATWLNYGVAKEEYTSNLATTTFSANQAKRTWQGIVYVPENLHNSDEKKTTLYFDGKVNGEFSNPYSLVLNKARTDAGETRVLRSKFYDIVASAKSRDKLTIENLKVADFTTKELVYGLHGNYFLHVDKTEFTMKGGEEVTIVYESDTDIELISPEAGGKEIFKFEKKRDEENNKDLLLISINPEISFEDSQSLPENQFFHIKAGTLVKKIDVTLDCQPFINVNPQDLTLNVRELKASGDYSGSLPVKIETNLREIKIELVASDDWTAADSEHALKLTSSTNGDIVSGNNVSVNGVYTVNVTYRDLNSTNNFWKNSHSLVFKVSGKSGSWSKEIPVTIDVKPAIDDYIIHLKADGWSNPHIYVYQCLELPADFWGMAGNVALASKPIGYSDAQNQYFAALEYSFTGKIAFKGWNYTDNRNSLDGWNQGNWKYGSEHHGFFLFKDCHNKPDGICDWNASKGDSDKRYNKNLDFCKDQRNNGCSLCNSASDYNKMWPGVRMKLTKAADGSTWYTFRLTGVATPGKALIMFTDGHNFSSGQNRYPGEAEVGIPLFDFPNREGWFDVSKVSEGFKSSGPKIDNSVVNPAPNPGPDPIPSSNTYRIYFKWNLHNQLTKLRIWHSDLGINIGGNYFDYNNTTADAGNGGTYYKGENGWAWLQFDLTLETLPATFDWGMDNNRWGNIQTNKFDSNNCLYIKDNDAHDIISGIPY